MGSELQRVALLWVEAHRQPIQVERLSDQRDRIAIIVNNVAHAVPLIREPLDLDRLPVGFYPEESYALKLAAQLAAALEGK